MGDRFSFDFGKTACRHGGRTDADTGSDHRLLRIIRDAVLVHRDMGATQCRFSFLAGDVLGAQVNQEDVAFGATGNDAQAALFAQHTGHHTSIVDHLFLIIPELGRGGFLEGHGLGGDDVLQRTTLQTGENGGIDGLFVLGLHQDDAAARATQGLVRGRSHHIGERHRVRVETGGDQAGVVGHVDPENSADFLGDFGKALEIDAQRIGRGAGHNQARLVFAGQGFHLVVVNGFVGVETVGNHVEPFSGHIKRHTVGEVTAFGQAHAHDGVAGLAEGHQHGLVGLRTGVRLDIGGIGTKQFLQTVNGNLLGLVNVFTTTVITLARIAFGVLVGELGALRFHDGLAHVVFGRDQFDVVFLTLDFGLHGLPEFRVNFCQGVFRGKHGNASSR